MISSLASKLKWICVATITLFILSISVFTGSAQAATIDVTTTATPSSPRAICNGRNPRVDFAASVSVNSFNQSTGKLTYTLGLGYKQCDTNAINGWNRAYAIYSNAGGDLCPISGWYGPGVVSDCLKYIGSPAYSTAEISDLKCPGYGSGKNADCLSNSFNDTIANNSVPTGGTLYSKTITATVPGWPNPTSSGSYVISDQLCQFYKYTLAGATHQGECLPVNITVTWTVPPPPTPSCTVSAPSNILAGSEFSATFYLANRSLYPKLGSLSPRDTMRWGINRVDISGNSAESSTTTYDSFVAPTTPGVYNFDWGLVADSANNWYGGYQNPTIVCHKQITVTQPQPDSPSCSMSPASKTISPGDSVTLTWSTSNADSVSSNFGATGTSGTNTVSPASTTTYTLTPKKGSTSGATCSSTVTVATAPGQPSCTLQVLGGDSPFLLLTSTAARSYSISFSPPDDGGGVSNPYTGSLSSDTSGDTIAAIVVLQPPPNVTSIYTATVYSNVNYNEGVNNGATATCSTTYTPTSYGLPPVCSMFTATTLPADTNLVKGMTPNTTQVKLDWTLSNFDKDKTPTSISYSDGSSVTSVTSGDGSFTIDYPDLEDRINGGDHALSYVLTINYTGSDGNATTTCNASLPIISPGNYPYLRSTNNDTWSGAMFSTSPDGSVCSNYDTSDSFTKQTLDLAGKAQVATNGEADPTQPINSSGSDYGIFSTGKNDIPAYPFLARNGTQNTSINRYDLTFANWPDAEYGKFTAEPLCLPDYYSVYDTAKADTKDVVGGDGVKRHTIANLTTDAINTPAKRLLGDVVVKRGTDTKLSDLFADSSLPSLTIYKQDFVTLLVDGNLTIDRNIKYDQTGVLGSFSMPSLIVIVKGGDINIESNVTELSGIFIAQPNISDSDSDGKYTVTSMGGNIDTCSNIDTPPNTTPFIETSAISNSCKNPLKINGSLVAQTLSLNRLRGSIKTGHTLDGSCLAITNIDSCAAEWDKFDPSVYLSRAYGITPDVKSQLGQVQSTRSLPPIY